MRWPDWTPEFEYRIRIVLLAVAVLLCVALPYAVIRNNADAMMEASAWVVHSAQVKEKFHALRLALIETENTVVSRFAAVPRSIGRPDYQTTRSEIEPLFAELSEATKDNVEQQNRIGALGVVVKGRLKLYDEAMQDLAAKNFDAAAQKIRQAADLFGSREYASQILAFEDELYRQRSMRLANLTRSSRWAMTGALVAQLLLLASVMFISERQASRRRKAESRARLAVERSRIIVQSLREPIAVLDQNLRVLMTNQAFGEFYGKPEAVNREVALEELGEGSWEGPELHQRLLDVGARGRELWDYELAHRSADGIERIVLVNARRMELSDDAELGDHPGILLTVTDVTARKRYEQRIQELNEDLEKKVEQFSEVNRELESFSYSVSHDLRAPLRHIAGFSDKLGAHIGSAADDKAHHYLGVISDSARRMSSLIEDLLEYSRLGRSAFRLEPVNMNALVTDVIAMLQSNIEGRAIDWQIAQLPVVMGDRAMLRRVWQNLISNAIKYTSRRQRAEIEIGLAPSTTAEIVFFVRDNGTGFDMAYAGKLFGVFQRLHKASEFPGTGIGLANVRRVISRHGGRTWAEAETDKGTTIFFTLPGTIGPTYPVEAPHES
ncbi:MAG: PAS domain S-box protein [Xanthomonadales bacterium]|nr:PAS domain S-box protein [Xanthomonadales bacterium]